MTTKSIRYTVIALIMLFNSCSFTKDITIDIVSTPKVFLPTNFKQIAIVNAAPYNNLILQDPIAYKKSIIDSIASTECAKGIVEGFEGSLFYNGDAVPIVSVRKRDSSINANLFKWELIEDICIKTESDLLIAIEYYSLNGKVLSEYSVLQSYPKVKINLYDPVEKKLLDSYIYTDTLEFDLYNEDIYTTMSQQDKIISNSLKETGYWVGKEYSERIFPFWNSVNRFYYQGEYDEFKMAELLLNEGKYELAAKEWLKMVNFKDKITASNAAFNVSLVFEILDNIDKAIEWAEKSIELKSTDENKAYLKILKARKKDQSKMMENNYIVK